MKDQSGDKQKREQKNKRIKKVKSWFFMKKKKMKLDPYFTPYTKIHEIDQWLKCKS